uniref:Tripartite motif containing 56 n=1 Tax=Pseudonaja textilis TaxID=8673 RepID=A0A670ZJH6_PSETE
VGPVPSRLLRVSQRWAWPSCLLPWTEGGQMAAKESSLRDALSSHFLTCPLCLERYRQPKILPCLHSYCQACLKKLLGASKRELRCPECRELVPLPAGVEGLKTNFFLNGLLDLVPPAGEKARATCSLCPLIGQGASSVAVSHCIDCADHLCQACARGHRCSRLTHGHLVVDLEAYCSGRYNEEVRKHQASRCRAHRGEALQYFCLPCAAALCRECRLGPHLEHSCLPLSEAAQARRPVITGLLAGVEEKLQLIAKGKVELEEAAKELEVCNRSIRHVVEQTCAKAVEQLLSQKEAVLDQLSGYLEERKEASGRLLSELGSQEQVACGTVAFVQKVLSLGQEEEIASLEQTISERLRQLQGFSWETLALPVPKLHIQPDLLCAGSSASGGSGNSRAVRCEWLWVWVGVPAPVEPLIGGRAVSPEGHRLTGPREGGGVSSMGRRWRDAAATTRLPSWKKAGRSRQRHLRLLLRLVRFRYRSPNNKGKDVLQTCFSPS